MPAIPPSANDLCHCGSRKKYKRCCRERDRGSTSLHQKLQDGSLSFVAQVRTNAGSANSFTVNGATVTHGHVKKELVTAPVTLSINEITGNKTQVSQAQLVVPSSGTESGTTSTIGNATVSMQSPPLQLALPGGKRKLKISSASGMFVILRIGTQRDDGTQYFDVLFGQLGQSEELDTSGQKMRPHIAIAPDGNGKFLRLRGHQCEVESTMNLHSSSGPILPDAYKIRSLELGTCIELRFAEAQGGVIELQSVSFVA